MLEYGTYDNDYNGSMRTSVSYLDYAMHISSHHITDTSKMDRNRIVEAIKILKQFDLQVILSAPPEKVNDISKIVDQTLIVTRNNNRSFIDLYKIK